MFKINGTTMQVLIKSQMWGPLLVGVGVAVMCIPAMSQSQDAVILGSRLLIASLLVVSGLLIMFIQVWPRRAGAQSTSTVSGLLHARGPQGRG